MRRRIPINGSHEDETGGGADGVDDALVDAPDDEAGPTMSGGTAEAAASDSSAADAGIEDAGIGESAPADIGAPEAPDDEAGGADGLTADAEGTGMAAALADAEAAELAAALADALDERDQYLEALQRLKAEFENYRRRSQRDITEAGSRARAAVVAEFLPILDNLDRALSAAEHHEEGKVLEGVRMTHNLFAGLLRKEGVLEVEALGKPFDPTVHEALLTQPSDEHEEGTVTAVLERGYTCGDRVLRPAKVAVSSGPSA